MLKSTFPAAVVALVILWGDLPLRAQTAPGEALSFNRDIRAVLSNHCFQCHGPDATARRGGTNGLRLDTAAGATEDLGGYAAVVPGKPEESEFIRRIESDDPAEAMPPPETGKKLTPREKHLLTEWIRQGAPYAKHWSYEPPVRAALPVVPDRAWPRNEVDYFILAALARQGLTPAPEADRYTLIRRLALDLTGLPPTVAEVDEFVNDSRPDAYEQLVERLLHKDAYGEHWARLWLDLARYADSAGYADDPPRTIWAYRDYVIRALNENKPFDQFTIEQIAGDLLPNPTDEQLVATALHRNTLTNNEGGTNDEEFRNVAIVDRVNTTMAIWMGTTINCCQCHSHKYDPISQADFYRLFAFFNNTMDADRPDESPVLELWTDEQQRQKAAWQAEREALQSQLRTMTPELGAAQERWEAGLMADLDWRPLGPESATSESGVTLSRQEDGSVLADRAAATDSYTLEVPIAETARLTALRLEALPHESLPAQGPGFGGGNFVLTGLRAEVVPGENQRPSGRFVRIEIPGQQKILSLAEVQVLRGDENLAVQGEAAQSTTDFDGPARLAIDGNTNGRYFEAKSTTHTAISDNPWWEVDLKSAQPVDRIVVWNRTDGDTEQRLRDYRIVVLDEQRNPVWEQAVVDPPLPDRQFVVNGPRPLSLVAAYADHAQTDFAASHVLQNPDPQNKGWAIADRFGQPHALTLVASGPIELPAGSRLRIILEQKSRFERHTLGHFRLLRTADARAGEYARIPANVLAALRIAPGQRSAEQQRGVSDYFLSIAPELQEQRDRAAQLERQLAELKPSTTVPVLRELPPDQRRVTRIQHRGNFLDPGDEVTAGVPDAWHPLPAGEPLDRLALARWLVSSNNPLTPRVVVNRYWEQLFGQGIVGTSEEFGSQGELPTHPELLDWLATELVRARWDVRHILRLLVTSATYRQSSAVTPELLERDPDNRWLSRGPRFRLSAETVRDQALFVAGQLSSKMYGPPVKPLQPQLGVSAAFGGGIDWQTSEGDDRFRRGLYTTWRRSNPYPSMATFDAPNREVCTLRRARTNTPLQALVTLNDPVYVEAAQALARRMAAQPGDASERARFGFRLCLARPPRDEELKVLVQLYESAREKLVAEGDKAQRLASQPLGPLPAGQEASELAAWTVVGNVLLNLDETLMKR